mmetsp:Transcript_7845/g.20666  ORF Transcript_7845/g.20666 Transcript_7845/m.20666 type:complete len:203 (+) Transcript_7845:99-707(+)
MGSTTAQMSTLNFRVIGWDPAIGISTCRHIASCIYSRMDLPSGGDLTNLCDRATSFIPSANMSILTTSARSFGASMASRRMASPLTSGLSTLHTAGHLNLCPVSARSRQKLPLCLAPLAGARLQVSWCSAISCGVLSTFSQLFCGIISLISARSSPPCPTVRRVSRTPGGSLVWLAPWDTAANGSHRATVLIRASQPMFREG